jgi:hypothetical protein
MENGIMERWSIGLQKAINRNASLKRGEVPDPAGMRSENLIKRIV